VTDKLKKAFDPSAARRVLQKGIDKGLWTLEDLDVPTQGYLLSTGQKWNKEKRCLEWNDSRTPLGHSSVIPKHQIKPHRNLLRDPKPVEAVQASADPRDFDPRPVSDSSGTGTQVLGQEEEPIYSKVSVEHSEREAIPDKLPF
jgi:hypothetical protein